MYPRIQIRLDTQLALAGSAEKLEYEHDIMLMHPVIQHCSQLSFNAALDQAADTLNVKMTQTLGGGALCYSIKSLIIRLFSYYQPESQICYYILRIKEKGHDLKCASVTVSCLPADDTTLL